MKILRWHIVLVILSLALVSCNETLNPITNMYKALTSERDYAALEDSKELFVQVQDFKTGNRLNKAIINVLLPDKRLITAMTDSAGIASIPMGGGEIIPGNCEIEVCFSFGSEQSYGKKIFFLSGQTTSTVSVYVNRGDCEKKYIKFY